MSTEGLVSVTEKVAACNKRYVERPVVIKDERSILDHREWCQQFYSDPAKAID